MKNNINLKLKMFMSKWYEKWRRFHQSKWFIDPESNGFRCSFSHRYFALWINKIYEKCSYLITQILIGVCWVRLSVTTTTAISTTIVCYFYFIHYTIALRFFESLHTAPCSQFFPIHLFTLNGSSYCDCSLPMCQSLFYTRSFKYKPQNAYKQRYN